MIRARAVKLEPVVAILAVVLLCGVAVAPLLRVDTPCTHDGGLHYYRVTAMRQALKDSILFTRYLPDLAFGYGYPFFNYREPLSYYLSLGLYLTGLPLPLTLNLVYVLSILGCAVGAYLLARDLFGPWAGIVAAVAYAYAPYQFLDALLRGNAPESVALPLLPLILWAFRRLALSGRRRWFVASVLALTALYLNHHISSLLFTPFLVAYLGVLWLAYRRRGHWIATGGALLLALGLATAFVAPALLEREYVQLHMSRTTRNNDFHYNFLTLAEIFTPPRPVDTSLMNPPMRIHLGLAQAILAAVGLVAGLIRSRGREQRGREQRATLVFFALAAVALIGLSTRAALWLWENIPLISFVQFPWRLVGRAALPVAVLAGVAVPFTTHNVQHVSRITHHASRITHYVLLVLLILSAFPSTFPPQGHCSSAPYPTITDVFAYERSSKLVGVDPEGSYFPVWVQHRPTESPLEKQYAAGGPVTRFDETALPAGGSVIEADYGPNRARITVETPTAFRARYLAFYFPGWRVTVDGEPVLIAPTEPEGLIAFDVLAGQHTITIHFGETPLRLAADAVSILSLIALIVIVLRYPQIANRKSQIANDKLQGSLIVHCSLPHYSLSIAALALLTFKLAVVDRTNTLFRHPTLQADGTLPGVEHTVQRSYADGLTLPGYDQDRKTMPADGTLRLDLYWTADARPGARYQSVIHLVGPDGLRWSHPDSFRPRGYADYPDTPTWTPGHYALDSHEVEPLPGTPPGTYDVVLTVFDRDTLAPLSVLNDQGQPAAPELTLGQVTLTRPRRPAELPEENRLNLSLMDWELVAASFDRTEAAPGDIAYLTLLWYAKRDGNAGPSSRQCYQTLALLTPRNQVAATYALSTPTISWQEGDVWRSQHQLLLPASLETATYTWAVEWCALSSDAIGQIDVNAPPHIFTPPTLPHSLNTPLGETATLVGFDMEPGTIQSGNPLTVTLAWRAEETPTVSYHVFVHLLNSTGALVAQSDGIPAQWSRPTTGWLPGEYIVDPHTLTIPQDAAGEYTLVAGLYIPGGARLTTPDGADAISLTVLNVSDPETQ